MNKIFKLTATSLLVSGVSLPTEADVGKAACMSPIVAAAMTQFVSPTINSVPELMKVGRQSDKNILRFTFQHYLNLNGVGVPLPKETIAITPAKFETNPLFFLEILKQPYAQLDLLTKPVQANTLIEWLLPKREAKVFGKLPALLLTTNISAEGTGETELVGFPYQREVQLPGGKPLFDWKGLKGQFTFTNQPGSLALHLNLLGLTIEETGKGLISLGESTFEAAFNIGADSSIIPSQIYLNLPSFKGHFDKEVDWNLQAITFNWNSKQTSKGLAIGETNLQLGHFDVDFHKKGSTGSLDKLKLAFKVDVQEQDDVANLTMLAEIGKLVLPKKVTAGEEVEVSYIGDMTLRRFDANALLTLQTIAKQLSKDPNETMALVMMNEKTMALIPQILAKSPEITFNDMLKTSKGNLQSQLIVGIDGEKVTALENPFALISALQAQATFSIDKDLFTQILKIMEHDSPRSAREVKEQLSMFIAKKWLIETDDCYKAAAEFRNGKLTVNEQELPIPLPFGMNQGPPGMDEEATARSHGDEKPSAPVEPTTPNDTPSMDIIEK